MSELDKETTFAMLRPVNVHAKHALSEVINDALTIGRMDKDNSSAKKTFCRIVYQGEQQYHKIFISFAAKMPDYKRRKTRVR